MKPTAALPFAALACALLAAPFVSGCSKPEPPEKDRPVEPQAQAQAQAEAAKAQRPYGNPHALRDYMQAPIEKAKTAETVTLEAAEKQRAAIDAQMAGEAPAAETTQ
jgi:hypothetical protein